MVELPKVRGPTACECWSKVVTSILEYQWQILQAPSQIGVKVLETVVGGTGGSAAAAPQPKRTAEEAAGLERRALERARQGLAPLREIYAVPYRDRIDWSAFPDWARPSDPEMYQGCGHEG